MYSDVVSKCGCAKEFEGRAGIVIANCKIGPICMHNVYMPVRCLLRSECSESDMVSVHQCIVECGSRFLSMNAAVTSIRKSTILLVDLVQLLQNYMSATLINNRDLCQWLSLKSKKTGTNFPAFNTLL